MKRIPIAVCVIALVFAVASIAQTPAQPKDEIVKQELIKLENAWANAELKHDLAFFEGIFADDFIMSDSDGVVSTRGQDIASLKSGESVFTSVVNDNMKVHVYGDTAVVFGRETLKGQSKGVDISGQYQWTDTWVKIAGHWKCVATHNSKIGQK
jgi:ketosteroid isomerase-like protein